MKLGAKMAAHASCQKASTERWSWEQQKQQEQVLTTPQERVALIPPQQTYTQSSSETSRPHHSAYPKTSLTPKVFSEVASSQLVVRPPGRPSPQLRVLISTSCKRACCRCRPREGKKNSFILFLLDSYCKRMCVSVCVCVCVCVLYFCILFYCQNQALVRQLCGMSSSKSSRSSQTSRRSLESQEQKIQTQEDEDEEQNEKPGSTWVQQSSSQYPRRAP